MLFYRGAPVLGEGALRTEKGVAGLRAAAAAHLSPAGQLQVATALEVIDALQARLHAVRHQLLDAARHLAGAEALAVRLYGVGPVTAPTITCSLAGAGRFSSARQAARESVPWPVSRRRCSPTRGPAPRPGPHPAPRRPAVPAHRHGSHPEAIPRRARIRCALVGGRR